MGVCKLLELEPTSATGVHSLPIRAWKAILRSLFAIMAEKKVDPATGEAYTLKELMAHYKGTYKKKELRGTLQGALVTLVRGLRRMQRWVCAMP